MEFREFFHIFVSRRNLFLGVFFGFLVLSLLASRFQPDRFETSLLVNVARSGMKETSEYSYDQFYRLQADERFADTVVRWLEEPSILETIRTRSGADGDAIDTLSAKRLSSQVIRIRYRSSRYDGFGTMAEAVPATLNDESARVNARSGDPDWFILVADDPVVRDVRLSFGFLTAFGIASGAFFAFWAVLFSWYFRGPEDSDGKR